MASASGGNNRDWSCSLKSIVAASCGSFSRDDIPTLSKTIILSEEEILNHEPIYESFYAPFVALSAFYIGSNAQNLDKRQINNACQACRVLLQYFLKCMKKCDDQSCLLQKQIMSLIKGLCQGTGYLQKSDVITLTAMMKSAKLPSHISSFSDEGDAEKMPKRQRLDPTALIVEQLMTPIHDIPLEIKNHKFIEMVDKDGDASVAQTNDSDMMKNLFSRRNASCLQHLNAGDIMVDECLSLPLLQTYNIKCNAAISGKPWSFPCSLADAACTSGTFKALTNELSIVKNTVTLPILEPLTDERLKKLAKLSISCLYVALSSTAAHSILNIAGTGPISKSTGTMSGCSGNSSTVLLAKEDDNDSYVVNLVENALEIFNVISSAIQSSTRAGGHNLQNLNLLGAWILLHGIQHIINLSPSLIVDKSKDNLKKTPEHSGTGKGKDSNANKQTFTKIQQGFGVFCVAICNQILTLLTFLLNDLKVESCLLSSVKSEEKPSNLDILGNYTAWQRVLRLTTSINLTSFLFNLASISYRKACILKRIQKHPNDGDNFSTTDSNTYYSDDFSYSDDSSGEDGDDDSEPILGKWFEETLSVTQNVDTKGTFVNQNNIESQSPTSLSVDLQSNQSTRHSSNVIPEKGEPHGFIKLASKIFSFVDCHLLNSSWSNIFSYLQDSFNEQHMVIVAGIIRDLDRETSRSESGTISLFFGAVLGRLYDDFSQALSCFIHNLLATEILSDNLQRLILTQLGVFPDSQDSKEEWPLLIYPRTLAVVAQVLLVKQQREKECLKNESEISVVNIWIRLFNTLKKKLLNANLSNSDDEDINVEHLQLLLFLFQTLQLMQKKGVLLVCAQTLIDVSAVTKSPMPDQKIVLLSRLLMIFEYFMKYLYDAPAVLTEHVHSNLFSAQLPISSSGNEFIDKETETESSSSPKLYFLCKDLEESYRKLAGCNDNSAVMKPRFYHVCPIEPEVPSMQETPKLDGLACSFVFCTPEVMKYSDLYDALLNFMSIYSQADVENRSSDNSLSALGNCAIQYCALINWRLMLSLPPSLNQFRKLASQNSELTYSEIMHALIWVPRVSHETFAGWIKLSVVKQGLNTTQAESLLSSISKSLNCINFDLKIAEQILKSYKNFSSQKSVLSSSVLPRFHDICIVDMIVAKIQVAQDKLLVNNDEKVEMAKAKNVAQNMLPMIFNLIEHFSKCARSAILNQFKKEDTSVSKEALEAYDLILQISSTRTNKIVNNAKYQIPTFNEFFPNALKSELEKWNSCTLAEFPSYHEWQSSFESDPIPSESYLSVLYKAHVSTFSSAVFSINSSLKHALYTLVHFGSEMIVWANDEKHPNELVRVMFPLVPDALSENLTDFITLALERIIGSVIKDKFKIHLYKLILSITYELIVNYPVGKSGIDEKILYESIKFWESLLDQSAGKKAIESFFTSDKDLLKILLSISNKNLTSTYGTAVLKFFNKLLQLVEKKPDEKALVNLCSSMTQLAKVESAVLREWLNRIIYPSNMNIDADLSSSQENRLLLQSFTAYMVIENSPIPEEVSVHILKVLISMTAEMISSSSDGAGVSELMVVMGNLAGAGSGSGHVPLFKASLSWLATCKKYLMHENVLSKIEDNKSTGKHHVIMETTCYLMSYISDVVSALRLFNEKSGIVGRATTASPPCDESVHHLEVDSDWVEDLGQDEDDSAAEDSDEDSLCNKLCSFTVTQKKFINQHWYHCHTCKMVDSVGVCTICAKVCHRDHDVTYAKYGSFFCDCGAKEDNSCQALVKRSSQSNNIDSTGASASGMSHTQSSSTSFAMDTIFLPSSLRRPTSSSVSKDQFHQSHKNDETSTHRQKLFKQLEGHKDVLVNLINSSDTVENILDMIKSLMSLINESKIKESSLGNIARVKSALEKLHSSEKSFETNDYLLVPTLGSQEGAFENVRMNYSGDQGQTIRHLINTHMIRRVAMCCLSSPHGRRQHLAVSHEKGKITVLQLSALLKQSDSSKRKLTLTRLASAPVPFAVLSMTGNPCNEDFLAVSGLKDCHILTFTNTGSVCDHLVLHPQLDTANYIIKALWLSGSQTCLALITADFVKIYDLAIDALSPQYYFLLPTSKIKDCTFVFSDDGKKHLLFMCTAGNIYSQAMSLESSAQHGPFYVTNNLEVQHHDLKEKIKGQIGGGGVSIYYSHSLQLLFFSYSNGKSFIAPLKYVNANDNLSNVFAINYKTTLGSNSNNKGSGMQPLCQWSEIPNHPGLVTSLTQSSNNPVIFMIKPNMVYVQEIKVLPAKTKITDMVTIRHPSTTSTGHRTTLILLCEDGSLRIYMAGIEQTGFWFGQPSNLSDGTHIYGLPSLKVSKKKKNISSQLQKVGRTSGSVSFAVDYFEHAQCLSDIDFGGNDVLQVYNTAQLKHRLNSTGFYVASTKPGSFTIEVTNNDNSMVIVGVRILVGSQDIQRAPSYVEIMGRTQQMAAIMVRSRWFDFPLTHEESLNADKKISIIFGSCADNVTMIDSIKVYGKTKDAFGWPEENEESLNGNVPASNSVTNSNHQNVENEAFTSAPLPISSLDRLIGGGLEVLDCCFSMQSQSEEKSNAKQTTIELATDLLTYPAAASVGQHAKTLLAVLHPNRTSYNNHKDQAILKSTNKTLLKVGDMSAIPDVETYFRLVLTTRSVAVSRPSNLVKYTDNLVSSFGESDNEVELFTSVNRGILDSNAAVAKGECSSESQRFLVRLVETFWKLHSTQPENPSLAPVCQPLLTHVETMVQALVDIIHAFTSYDLENVQLASKLYVRLLLCSDPIVSFACKQAMIRVLRPRPKRRRVFIPSPPHCSSPGPTDEPEPEKVMSHQQPLEPSSNVLNASRNGCLHPSLPPSEASQESSSSETEQQFEVVDQVEPMVLLSQENIGASVEGQQGAAGSLEALFPPMLDIPPDADDETMVELAIALSLQDQPGQSGEINLQGLSSLAAQAQRASLEGGHYSDSTASVGASDDEGSTAATDGSTLRTSPAEQGGSAAGSESGGSAVDSIITEHNVSGRSSAYGDNVPESVTTGARSETSSVGIPSSSLPQETDILTSEIDSCDFDTSKKLHSMRLMLLEKLLYYLPELRDVGGVRIIPYMQVLLMLSSDVDIDDEKDRMCLDNLVSVMISELNITATEQEIAHLVERTPKHEVQLVIMRLLSVMMSRSKAGTLKAIPSSDNSSSFISNATANALLSSGAISFCLTALKSLLNHWKNSNLDTNKPSITSGSSSPSNAGNLLKPQPSLSPAPDMSPFFLRQYVRGHANDVFEAYPQLLTEMVFRLPYQMKKIINLSAGTIRDPLFDQSWYHYLCEYMMTQQTPFVRRQVRKLLLFICGSKEKYRQLRDLHALETHMKKVKSICQQGGFGSYTETGRQSSICLPYDSLITLIEHLRACTEIATARTTNWQKFCLKDETILTFLMKVSALLDDGISPIILQLLQCAICGMRSMQLPSSSTPSSGPLQAPKSKKSDKNVDKAIEDNSEEFNKFDETQCLALVLQVNRVIEQSLLKTFIQSFLLESNQTSVRWQAHSLILQIFRNSSTNQQEALLDLLWKIWPLLSSYGRKAAQFVDVLGYFTLKMLPHQSGKKVKEYVEKSVELLRMQNGVLANHPNANIYNSLLGLVEFDGFFLESDPCLVCSNPEVAFTNVKLSAIKVDSRFTTTTQIVKLIGSHTISKINLRIGDLKRAKMVRTINVYYNNRTVQAVVELKNKPAMWHKAKSISLASGQTDVKIEFLLPIVACNLMVEYSEFYENIQASSETLQCPRCSASVPANPGVCANCGENVFQCHKCRSINYDERDPFLCNACGFCKYAKFDYTLTAKSCSCSTDPIENEEDRKKTVSSINNLLEKADRVYKQLMGNKAPLEALLMYINDRTVIDSRMLDSDGVGINNFGGNNAAAASHPGLASVSRAIQQLAQRYCGDCKSLFDELSKIIQKVLASRKELVDYDCQQKDSKERQRAVSPSSAFNVGYCARENRSDLSEQVPIAIFRCYGCASAATEYCITLLRALATSSKYRQMLCNEGQLLRQLVEHNLRRGSLVARYEVRQLLCLLTRDNIKATNELNTLIMEKISTALKGQLTSPDLVSSIRHEMGLLATSVQKEDSCWEQKLRCIMKLFLLGVNINTPVVFESLTLPCLNILQSLIKPATPSTRKNKDKHVEDVSSIKSPGMQVHVDVKRWLSGHPDHSYKVWKQRVSLQRLPKSVEKATAVSNLSKAEVRAKYLSEKFYTKWRTKIEFKKQGNVSIANKLKILDSSWLRLVMFCPSSRSGRQAACTVVESLCQIEGRKKEILDMLTKYLDDVGKSGESASQFLTLYQSLIKDASWKYYLAVKGVLPYIGNLITKEIEQLTSLEENTLNSDLSQGYALKMLTELLASFLEQDNIKHCFKGRLVGTVLNGYLSLRKLVIQRTKLIDDTQDKLLELLEGMTTGTESETRAFMSVCVETVKKYPEADMRTPLFIFERLCSIIFPEENNVGEFFMTLEKDPQQEDFLQGRMLGNPYSSSEPGLGPLMRDVKNKICQDCELVALLEDDSGMELLVNNKIISLDLPVKDVYKKIWCADNNDVEAMRIVYRMRGLLGDATEEFIETLEAKNREEVDNEEVYKMANVMSYCGGLEVMLQRLSTVGNLSRGKSLLTVLLKLFCHCIKVKANRQKLTDPSMKTIEIMLGTLKLALSADSEIVMGVPGGPTITEQLLHIMENILVEACVHSVVDYAEFSTTCGDEKDIQCLLSHIISIRSSSVGNGPLLQQLMRVLPFLSFASKKKMQAILDHFKPYLDFNKFDFEHSFAETTQLECFCYLSAGIEDDKHGNQFKDMIVENDIVKEALEYITMHAPPIKTVIFTDSDEWKEFVAKPALKFVLKILTGLSQKHETIQNMVSADCIPILHRLEQMSSNEHVGSLAENLIEALKENAAVAQKIENARRQTKSEKKRLAMAMREKQLGALGMKTNEKGQVKAKSSILTQMGDLMEETGLVCVICREGYEFQPTKVLGIYTFTKRVNMDDYENKSRNTPGYVTVSHFNVVHIDCHLSAYLARGRDEWESAALQNANTKCNGLLPLWGPQVLESCFANCLARHNTYLQECTGHRDISYNSTIHDVKLLLQLFCNEKSFSDESGGGGPQSNMHLIPYLIHMALYVINTTRSVSREEKNISNFLQSAPEKWIENSFEVESSYYWATMCLIVNSTEVWAQTKISFLKRILAMVHIRNTLSANMTHLADKSPKEYAVYRPGLLFFALVNGLYSCVFKNIVVPSGGTWSMALADYIRHNDQALIESTDRLLKIYQEDMLTSQSFMEFCDVTGLLEEIPDPDKFLSDAVASIP